MFIYPAIKLQLKWLMWIGLLTGFFLCASPVQAADAPVVTAPVAATDQTATWNWNGSSGSYRYSLDNETAWSETTDTTFTPSTTLSEGNHTLYVQESDGAGGWTASGSATLYCLLTDTDATVLISDAADLTAFSDFVNAAAANGTANARLTADITLACNSSNQWRPIGKDINFRYQGIFDGLNHTISGIYINTTDWKIGLFGFNSGTIQNLTIKSSSITGGNEVGAIAGYSDGTQLINCHSNASVLGNTYVGGITGLILGSIANCSNTGSVTGNVGYVGGITGFQQGNISNCYNSGTVTTETGSSQIGGISGTLFSGLTQNCYNSGQIKTEYSMGLIRQGSIIGSYDNSSGIIISNCYYLSGTAPQGIGCFNSTSNPADIPSQTAAKIGASFNNGEVAWLLQGTQTSLVWGQTLSGSSPDSAPVLTGQATKKVCRISLDYEDSDSSDTITYKNPGDVISIPQTSDYAVSLNGNPYTSTTYTITDIDADFVLKKREAMTGLIVNPYSGTFDGSDHPAVTVGGQPATATVTYSSTGTAGTFTSSVPQVKDVGHYTVYVKVTDYGYNDYESESLPVTVYQASAPVISSIQKYYTYTKSYPSESIDLAALLPADRGTTTCLFSSIDDIDISMFDPALTLYANGTLTYGVKAGNSIGTCNTIAVKVTSQNYADCTLTVIINITDNEALTISGITCSNKTYDGNPASPTGTLVVTDSGGTAVDPGTLAYNYTSTDGGGYNSSNPPTAAGSYQLVISVAADNVEYNGSSSPIPFTISRKDLFIKALDQTITVGMDRPADAINPPGLMAGETISDISFSCGYIKGDAVYGLAGTYPITPSGGTISSGNGNYNMTYTSGTLTVNPSTPGGGGGGGGATPDMSGIVITPQSLTYDANGLLSPDISGLPSGAVIYYSLDGTNYTTDPPEIQHAGQETLYLKITCPGYTDYQTEITFSIAKQAAPEIPAFTYDLNVGTGAGSSPADGSIDLAALLPGDAGTPNFSLSGVTDSSGLLPGNPAVSPDGILSFGSSANETLAAMTETGSETATISVLVTMENYEDTTITVIVTDENEAIGVRYCTHIQDYGWENDWLSDGALSGTVGQSKRLEALKIELTGDVPEGAGIETSVHVQNYGNLGPFAMGTEAGTSGQGLRMEEITLNLVNLPGYTLYYNVQVQNKGWLKDESDVSNWFVSGQTAGTRGQSLRLESIRIKLVKNQ
ncbi:MBG domain-containing protein [Eubacteriaceae bacterium ES2]|nr:MBG domain-containing protein [Eubacteriaceae bacterium ES2]